MTIGRSAALMVPSSGIVTWKSDSTSEKVGLERLVGAIQLVDQQDRRPSACGCSASSSGRRIRNFSSKISAAIWPRSCTPCASARPDLDHLAGVVPLIHRRGDVEALVALQADQRPLRLAPAPWRSRSCRRPPRLRRTTAARACSAR